jgi:hypothetical protein
MKHPLERLAQILKSAAGDAGDGERIPGAGLPGTSLGAWFGQTGGGVIHSGRGTLPPIAALQHEWNQEPPA